MENEEAKELLIKYDAGQCTEAEKALVEDWYMQYNEHDIDVSFERIEALRKKIYSELPRPKKVTKLYPALTTAAALILLTAGIWLYFRNYHTNTVPVATYVNDIGPGSNKAILTLINGKTINLNDAKNGLLAKQDGIEVIKKADGQLAYKVISSDSKLHVTELNTISTPRGGQYQIILPDGSKVWLNAASVLKFPPSFIGSANRKVELNGEAYFEITKDSRHPFIVKSKTQTVEVLGTHFNINTYTEEINTKTTLVEGSVKINKNTILKPGEQAINSGSAINIVQVDVENAIAWINGEFAFRNEPLENIMRKVARWYDVEVIYKDEQSRKKLFGGTISKFENVSEVLNMLELTGVVHFKIEERRIFVMP